MSTLADRSCFPIVDLRRGKETPDGTFGTLHFLGKLLCYTLEEPWRNNQRGISCIPTGRYFCTPWRTDTPDHSKAGWRLHDVPDRKDILIHVGNTLKDTEGCILVGLRPVTGGIADSRPARALLREKLPPEFWLEITKI